ncbi:alpha-amylase family glycosyl hydrolase [uncultured Sphingomonas sp.]|uniref:alpha-amylase family glycosyl hydrolase n=1 Tax=uncultured Sphingomonas sp. TaxID=158754 RepID=UPI00260F7ED4|nr:alpha-amylase family glycosyl hydrolase [uncultured Sphingomonas sp.]
MQLKTILAALAMATATTTAMAASTRAPDLAAVRARLPQDEVIYFLLPDRFENGDVANDRGGLGTDRLTNGFDPTDTAFYHGGDLKGVVKRLDYIQALGATTIWIAPIFTNKAVQGSPAHPSAGYHGYWITDFTHVDPHFGSDADFAALVRAAHARGMKVILDIVVNHTADVIQYRECPTHVCPYRSRADYPYQRQGGPNGAPINAGFAGDEDGSTANFAKLTRPDYAYTPYIPAGEEHEKTPAWLNDPIYYHNRGHTTFTGESATMGDFGGLDDLFTENPRVIKGFIDIYSAWIDRYGIDGYRIDTARHVDPAFWQAFVPAILARAKADGIPNFHIFGEVNIDRMDPGYLAHYTQVDRLPAVLDFAFRRAVIDTVADGKGTEELADLFAGDALYRGGAAAAQQLTTFISNHDNGRFASLVLKAHPGIADGELRRRVTLGYAMLMTLRGVPSFYYGDEQGFSGGEDQAGREDMFASQTAPYAAEHLIGTGETGARAHFETDGPLFHALAELARLRTANPALTEGRQIVRASEDTPGLFAVSRIDPRTGREIVVAFNTSTAPIHRHVQVELGSSHFTALHGACAATAAAPGSLAIDLAPLDYIVCAAGPTR